MKKALLTIGLFSMVMILTSFTTPTEGQIKNVPNINFETGGTSTGTGTPKKIDFETGGTSTGTGMPKKIDFETGGTSTGTGTPKKLD